MPIRTIEPRRLYRTIADQLRRLIEAGEYVPGARLPPERDLAVQFGVSRPSVREALIALEVEGLVEVRVGSGIYVRRPDPAHAVPAVSAEGPFEVLQARRLLEGELAALAAQTMNAGQVAGLRLALRSMRDEVKRGVLPLRGDRLFHQRIAEASGNGVLLRAATQLLDERSNPLYMRLGGHFEDTSSWSLAIEEHARVIEAITRHAPGEARDAMHLHLQRSQERFEASWGPPGESPPADGVKARAA